MSRRSNHGAKADELARTRRQSSGPHPADRYNATPPLIMSTSRARPRAMYEVPHPVGSLGLPLFLWFLLSYPGLLRAVVRLQPVEMSHYPVSSGLRTGHLSTLLAWSSPGLASTLSHLARTQVRGLFGLSRTSGAVARGLPVPGPLRRLALNSLQGAECTPRLIPLRQSCGERWTDRPGELYRGGHPNRQGGQWMPSPGGPVGCGSFAPPDHRTTGDRLWPEFWPPRTAGTLPLQVRTRSS
ncbi:Olfactory receptor [Trichinella pseudospiralis]